MSEHTPVPWGALLGGAAEPIITGESLNESARVCLLPGVGDYRANAEFIVRACNSYDETLGALRDALGVFQLLGSGQKPPFSCSEMCGRIGTAIAAAEGRKP